MTMFGGGKMTMRVKRKKWECFYSYNPSFMKIRCPFCMGWVWLAQKRK